MKLILSNVAEKGSDLWRTNEFVLSQKCVIPIVPFRMNNVAPAKGQKESRKKSVIIFVLFETSS